MTLRLPSLAPRRAPPISVLLVAPRVSDGGGAPVGVARFRGGGVCLPVSAPFPGSQHLFVKLIRSLLFPLSFGIIRLLCFIHGNKGLTPPVTASGPDVAFQGSPEPQAGGDAVQRRVRWLSSPKKHRLAVSSSKRSGPNKVRHHQELASTSRYLSQKNFW